MDPDNDQRQSNEELYAALSASQLTAVTAEDPSALLGRYAGAVGDDASTLPAAIPVLERELAEYAEDSPRVPLVPIYPKEGAAYADYPFAVLRAPWVDDVRRKAAADLLAHLRKPASRRTYEAAGFRDAEHVSRDRVRLDPERGFQGAVAAPERTTTAQALTQMLGVWGVLQRSNNALLLLDVSGSMNDPVPGTSQTRLQLVQRAAIAGAGLLNNGTTVGLWAFATDLTPTSDFRELVAPGPAGGTVGGVPRHQAVAGAVRGLRAAGGTGLYDTIGAAYDRMQRAWKPNARNMLVVMTDGKNEDESGLSLEQLLAKLKASARPDRPVTILAIAVGPKADATALEQITKVTGGRTFVERNDVSAIQQITLAFAGRVS
jgi:Ca-activated chloride channel homolog